MDSSAWATVIAGSRRRGTAITVRDYKRLHQRRDRVAIADMVRLRFEERYLQPVLGNPARHGFAMMAVSCLMVEALQSFRDGAANTMQTGSGEAAFKTFFADHPAFAALQPLVHEFYVGIRCGILHQAEATGSWRIDQRRGLLRQHGGVRWLSASEFGRALAAALDDYVKVLSTTEWHLPLWVNARRKLKAICKHCGIDSRSATKLN